MSGSAFRRASFNVPKPAPSSNQVREKERFELSTLNDKFADYVEKVRYLEAQNRKIQLDANHLTENQEENCQKIQTLFETEVSQLKQLAENLLKEKNTLFSDSQDTQSSIVSLKQHLSQTYKECDASKYESESLERELSSIDGDIVMYKRRLTNQDSEHTQWKQFITHIQRLLIQAKNEIHNETSARSSSEQTMKQIQISLTHLREQQQQKLKELKQSSVFLSTNSTNDRAHMFKSEVSNAIRRIRQDFEKQNESHRNEMYAQFTRTYEDISRQYPELAHLFVNDREQERIRQEEDRVRAEIQRLRTDSQLMKQKNAELKLNIRELQINIDMVSEEHQRIQQLQKTEIDQFRLKHDKTGKDYEDVVTKQTTLEKEIETYRNLLEGTMKPVVDHITEDYHTFRTERRHSSSYRKSHPEIPSITFGEEVTTLNNTHPSTDSKVPPLDLPKANDEINSEATKNENEVTNGSSSPPLSPNVRPPIIIQTRRNN